MIRSPYTTRHSQGFTLIELMVVIVIAAILLTIAVPSFDALIKRNNVDALQSRLASALATARTEAASRNRVITICASSNQTACSGDEDDWSNGWIVFEDVGNTGAFAAGDVIIEVHQITNNYTVIGPDDVLSVSFNSQGFMIRPDVAPLFTVCEPGNDVIYARGLFVNRSGLVMKSRVGTGGVHLSPGDQENLVCP